MLRGAGAVGAGTERVRPLCFLGELVFPITCWGAEAVCASDMRNMARTRSQRCVSFVGCLCGQRQRGLPSRDSGQGKRSIHLLTPMLEPFMTSYKAVAKGFTTKRLM